MLKYIPIFILLIAHSATAQNEHLPSVSGFVQYSTRITLGNKNYHSLDTLKFNRTKSLFQWIHSQEEQKLELDSGIETKKEIAHKAKSDVGVGQQNFYQLAKDSLYSRIFGLDSVYLLKAKRPKVEWDISDNTKNISGYQCTMATTRFRGRNYTVWFTPAIPVPYGPWKFIGLPGLIIKAYSNDRHISFTVRHISLYDFDKYPNLQISLNGKEKIITLEQYKHILATKDEKAKREAKIQAEKKAREIRRKFPNARINIDTKVTVPESIEIFADSTGQ